MEDVREKMLDFFLKYNDLVMSISDFAQCDVRTAEQIYQLDNVENMNESFFHLNEFIKLSKYPMRDISRFLKD